jgi:hypothetical protein
MEQVHVLDDASRRKVSAVLARRQPLESGATA